MNVSSKWTDTHLPCPKCGSSDALSTNDKGWSHCFSCGANLRLDKLDDVVYNNTSSKDNLSYSIHNSCSIDNLSYSISNNLNSNEKVITKAMSYGSKEYLGWRGITKDTFKAFNCLGRIADNGEPIGIEFPYGADATKVRSLKLKEFHWEGKPKAVSELFGQTKFSPGCAESITITEGEMDALSVFQMTGSKWPTVSVRSASSAKKDCEQAFKFLNSFNKIYLAFDNDEPGQKACVEVARLFDVNKVYHVQFGAGFKDANDYLTQGKQAEFNRVWWNAKKFLPKGIINSYEDIDKILRTTKAGSLADYPFPTLQEMTYGIREGELILFTAQEKVGKTEIFRAIEYSLLKNTDYNIGLVHLEEEEKRSVQGLLSYELNTPVHLPDCQLTVDDQLEAYRKLTNRDGRLHFYTHFGSDDPETILDSIRYLVTVCHCKFIFLDHITMLVTGYEGDDERKKLDYISTRLAMMTRELSFTLFMISHVNDEGKTRGSRNISKVADLIVHLERDNEAEDFDTRNTTHLLVRGNRYAAKSGPAGYLWFDPSTYKIKEKEIEDTALAERF